MSAGSKIISFELNDESEFKISNKRGAAAAKPLNSGFPLPFASPIQTQTVYCEE